MDIILTVLRLLGIGMFLTVLLIFTSMFYYKASALILDILIYRQMVKTKRKILAEAKQLGLSLEDMKGVEIIYADDKENL